LKEKKRQEECLTLIASENFTSPSVLEAQGSVRIIQTSYNKEKNISHCEIISWMYNIKLSVYAIKRENDI
ncbi:MAG: hypothetical protein Q8755_03410, partial [Candidatus Phytoplasma australasiaticum]|nr:hypothetical protein [Candidatus Phytoplasma australasiaticum]